jgi:hypothetical protein
LLLDDLEKFGDADLVLADPVFLLLIAGPP